MRVEFRQGVPEGCIEWLNENVGKGNMTDIYKGNDKKWFDWYYERIAKPISPEALGDDPFEYVPTITVKDPKLAMLFMLRWI